MPHSINRAIYVSILTNKESIGQELITLLNETQYGLKELYNIVGYNKSIQYMSDYITYLAESIAQNEILIFTDFIEWLRILIKNIGFDTKQLAVLLKSTENVINLRCSRLESSVVNQFIKAALLKLEDTNAVLPTFINAECTNFQLAKKYLNYVLNGEKQNAIDLILSAAQNGISVNDIYLDVFQSTQYEIGRLWQINKISVAQEHYCTALTQVIMSQLYPYTFIGNKRKTGHKFVATCISNELHEIGIRMVSDFLELDGWNTYYLGSNVPVRDVLKIIDQENPEIVGISTTFAVNLGSLEILINEIRKKFGHKNLDIIVGGYPFNKYPNLWNNLGADGYSKDARDAVLLCNQLIDRRQI